MAPLVLSALQSLVPLPRSFGTGSEKRELVLSGQLPSSARAPLFPATSSSSSPAQGRNKWLNYVKCFHFYLTPKAPVTPVEMLPGLGQQWDLSMNGGPGKLHLKPSLLGQPPAPKYSNSGACRIDLLAAWGRGEAEQAVGLPLCGQLLEQ